MSEAMDFDAFHKAVAVGDARTAYNLVAEHTEARTEERIIKLLEDPATLSNWWAMPDKSIGLYGNLMNYVIALIKGDNNPYANIDWLDKPIPVPDPRKGENK
jgi:hypothetical protein